MKLLDQNEKPISKRQIVTIKNEYFRHGKDHFQGLVVGIEKNIFGTECSIAVYFYSEVYRYCIENQNSTLGIGNRSRTDWIEKDHENLPDILFENRNWEKSRSVTIFKPKELIIENYWSEKTLVKRLVPNNCHSYSVSKKPFIPNKTKCWIKNCNKISTDLGLINVWGRVSFIHVCPNCYKQYKNFWSDSGPYLEIN